jgi:cytochrome c oxidase accessory protein FixG
VATHGVWLALSWVIGFHLIAYFVSPYELIGSLIPERRVDTAAFGFHVAFTLVTYLDMGIVRQSFCRYLCPYARFQSVLFDRDTLVVGYDADRGEPRGKRGSTEGDCVDCSLCVQVCPTAIDIREGLQLECIACTQCIDACDGVMERLGRATNLIGYRSLRSLEGGGPVRLLRPRVVVYGTSIALVIVAFVALVQTRVPLGLTVTHNRDSLYSQGADGRVGNAFDLRLENRDRVEHVLRLRLEEPGFELVAGQNPVTLAPISALDARVFVMAPHDGAKVESLHVVAESIEADGPSVVRPAHFLRPVGNPAAGMETKHGS